MNLNATMQTNYNGWSVHVDDDNPEGDTEEALCESIAEALPEITGDCYNDDGYEIADPYDYEKAVTAKIAELMGDRAYNLTIEYDEFSS